MWFNNCLNKFHLIHFCRLVSVSVCMLHRDKQKTRSLSLFGLILFQSQAIWAMRKRRRKRCKNLANVCDTESFVKTLGPLTKVDICKKHIQIISTFIWGNNARMKSFDLFLSKKFLLCHNFDEGPKDWQTEKQNVQIEIQNAKSNMTAPLRQWDPQMKPIDNSFNCRINVFKTLKTY